METFKPDWEEWIDLNLKLGNCKQQMFQKSLDKGYIYNLLHRKLGIEYISEKNNKDNTSNIALRIAQKINARNLELYTIDHFLTKEECDLIIQEIDNSDLTQSTVYTANHLGERKLSDNRTSQTCFFKNNSKIITELESRICKQIGINNRFSEQIQGQKYSVGQEFKRHVDFFDPRLVQENKTVKGQRTWTFMIYLNDVEEGGYTSFPYAFASIIPKVGRAVIWNNLSNKVGNEFSSHCGMPIIKGEKYILTKWFKDTETTLTVRNEICSNHFLPIFHPIGFEKISMKLPCIDAIKEWMLEHENEFVDEILDRHTVEKDMRSKHLDIHKAPVVLLDNLNNEFKNILTKWIHYKSELVRTSTYGIREYLRGSSLGNHYDKLNTHVISAIIHLGDVSDKPWDLYIEDHSFRPHNITMAYGDIVLYESTTCLHGRPAPFEGDSHRNMYIHFKPEKW
jgi:prolyl 4-hydroxylase